MFRTRQTHWFTLCGALLLSSVVACGDDDDAPSEGSEAGKSTGGGGTAGTASKGGSGTNPASGGDAGEKSEAGSPPASAGAGGQAPLPTAEGIYVVGYYLTVNDDYIGYLAVTDDLSADGVIDETKAVEFPGDMSYASPGDGTIYVGRGSGPVLERWALNDENELEKTGEMGLMQHGISTGLGIKDPMHFLEEDRAYFIDGETLQVVIWNPQTMETSDTFSLEGLREPDLFMSPNYVHRDGDRLLLSARYYRPDDTAALLTRVAIIDTKTDTVEYADDTRCGNVAFHAHDSQNNLYLASHPAQSAVVAVGAAGDPVAETCIIRINSGAAEFDEDYYVGMDALVDGQAGGIMQGAGDEAFILQYVGAPLTLDNYASARRRADWAVTRLTLGDESATLTKVEGLEPQSAYGLAFTTTVAGRSTPFIITVAGDLAAGQYHDVSVPGERSEALSLPGFPGKAILVK
jgi:hypothetical protein